MKRYDSFDGLRGFAAIGILLMHYQANLPVAVGEALAEACPLLHGRIIPFFTTLVYMFFILSAFSLCCGYAGQGGGGEKGAGFDANRFYGRRYARVWPFFALLVVVDFAMAPSAANLCQAFADLTLAFAFLPNPDIKVIGVGWFLGLVFLFYMIFPWFVFLLRSRCRAWCAMVAALVFHVVLVRYFLTPEFCTASQIASPRHNIVYSFPFFMAGGLLYLYRDGLDGWGGAARWALLSAALAATVLQFTPFQPKPFGESVLYAGLVFVLWVAYAATGGIAIRGGKLLDNPVAAFLGGLSMEIYLCHMMVFRVLEKLHPERFFRNPHLLYWGMCAAGLAGSVAFSWVVTAKVFPALSKMLRRGRRPSSP